MQKFEDELQPYCTNPFEFILEQYRRGRKIIVLGEDHSSREQHEFVSQLLRFLKPELGELRLGLEFNVKWQKKADQYVAAEGRTSAKYFEAGSRRGTNYGKILRAAAESGTSILCLDTSTLDDKDEAMAARFWELNGSGNALVYVGGRHAMCLADRLGGILKARFGNDEVFCIGQEVEGDVRKEAARGVILTYGFTGAISESSLRHRTLAFSLKDPGLRPILARIDEGDSLRVWGIPWYDLYDGFIYLAKDLKDLKLPSAA